MHICSPINCPIDEIKFFFQVSQYNEKPTNNHISEHEMRVCSVKDLLGLTGPHRHDPRRQKRYRIYYTKMPIPVSDLERRYKMRLQCMDEKMQISVGFLFLVANIRQIVWTLYLRITFANINRI